MKARTTQYAETAGDDVVWASGGRVSWPGRVKCRSRSETRKWLSADPLVISDADGARRWRRSSVIAPGDTIIADYVASIEAEVRAPTDEEEANPWVVLVKYAPLTKRI